MDTSQDDDHLTLYNLYRLLSLRSFSRDRRGIRKFVLSGRGDLDLDLDLDLPLE